MTLIYEAECIRVLAPSLLVTLPDPQPQLLIYSLVDEEAMIMVYDALLQHLDDEKIQKTLCEILCHLTVAANARLSSDVVKRWRVNRVIAVRNRVGSFSEIDFLLNIYQITKPDYFPKAFTTRSVH